MRADLRNKLGGLALVALLLPVLPVQARGFVRLVAEVCCLALVWAAMRSRQDLWARGWPVVFTGAVALGLSDVVQVIERQVQGRDDFPRPSHVLALAAYTVLAVGAALVERKRPRLAPSQGAIEAAVLGLGSLAPLLSFLVLPQSFAPSSTPVGIAVVVGFAAVDVALVTVAARFALVDHGGCPALRLLGGALLCWATAEFSYALSPAFPVLGRSVGPSLFLLGFVLGAAGLTHRSVGDLTYGMGVSTLQISPRRQVWLLGLGSLMPLLSLGAAWAIGTLMWIPALAVLGLLVSGLVWLRFARLLSRIDEQSEQLSDLARSDELTGLPNRRSWNYEVSRAVAVAGPSGDPLCLALLDLDHFKSYNDSYGHPAGDRLLRDVCAAWSELLVDGEVLARYGGEEFAMLLPGRDLDHALARVEEVRRAVPPPQTASAGVALWLPGSDPGQTLKDADGALYLAKRSGRDMALPAEPSSDSTPGPLRDLRTVVQPIVRVRDLEIVGFEGLSRFAHTASVQATFLDAHDKGYGDLLEAVALRKVIEEPARPAGVEIFVNVSERAMRSDRFWNALPHDLTGVVVELSEIRDGLATSEIRECLDRFRDRGARIGLDDVGTLSADFARIVTLRPDVAKIDRSLVARCDLDRAQAAVLRMLVEFAHSHDVDVCVEGVETAGELDVVRSLEVAYAQGFLLGRPEPAWPGRQSGVDRRSEPRPLGRHLAV